MKRIPHRKAYQRRRTVKSGAAPNVGITTGLYGRSVGCAGRNEETRNCGLGRQVAPSLARERSESGLMRQTHLFVIGQFSARCESSMVSDGPPAWVTRSALLFLGTILNSGIARFNSPSFAICKWRVTQSSKGEVFSAEASVTTTRMMATTSCALETSSAIPSRYVP